ncbi:hypothetical protein BDZ89DRAFT_1151100 [Hymenopellis radicata]|nr:hypothetical protein BDZ89DRAFT_1151100 [Hymenopellis radicata]
MSSISTLYTDLKVAHEEKPCNIQRCQEILALATLRLTERQLLADPGHVLDQTFEWGALILAREILEIGADCALIVGNRFQFAWYVDKLRLYYTLPLPFSRRQQLIQLAVQTHKLPIEVLDDIMLFLLHYLEQDQQSALFTSSPDLFYSSLRRRMYKNYAYGIVEQWYHTSDRPVDAEKFLTFLKEWSNTRTTVLVRMDNNARFALDTSYSPARIATLLISLGSFPPNADITPLRYLRLTSLTVLFDWRMSDAEIVKVLQKFEQGDTLQKLWVLAEYDEEEHDQRKIWRRRRNPFLTAHCQTFLATLAFLSSFAFSHPSPIIPMHDLEWKEVGTELSDDDSSESNESSATSSDSESGEGIATDTQSESDDGITTDSDSSSDDSHVAGEPRRLSAIHHEEEKKIVAAWAEHLPSLSHAYLAYCQSKVYNIVDGAHTNAPEDLQIDPMGAVAAWTKDCAGHWIREREADPSMGDMPFSQRPWFQDWFYHVDSSAAYIVQGVDVGLRYQIPK